MSVLTAPPLSVTAPAPPSPPAPPEPFGGLSSLRRFSVAEYHQMIKAGILAEGEPVELLEGYLVLKMPRNPQHDGPMDLFEGAIEGKVPQGWFIRIQRAITLTASEPEPDYVVVRGTRRDFLTRHPTPADIGLAVEMSNTSLTRDTREKACIYAHAGIAVYWVVNLVDRVIEVFTRPSGPADAPAYGQRDEFKPGEAVPVVLDGVEVGRIAVADVIP